MNRTLALLILFCLPYFSFSQKSQISGRVIESAGKPVSFVSVYTTSIDSLNIFTFASTNFEGYFELDVPGDSVFILMVKGLGYQNYVQEIQTLPIKEFKIILNHKTTVLDEVVIDSEALKAIIRNDTTKYFTDKYTDGSEETLSDVLKKLPGFSVEDSGTIYFKGKLVDNVFIDGVDVLGDNYAFATNKLKAGFVDEITAVENHNENPLLKGIKRGDKTILNISIPDDRKKFAFGDVDGKTGIEREVYSSFNVFTYFKKLRSFSYGGYNNIGSNSDPENSFNFEEVIPYTAHNKIITKNQIASALPSRSNFNAEWNMTSNLALEVSENINLRTDFTWYRNKSLFNTQTGSTYSLNESTDLEFGESNEISEEVNSLYYATDLTIQTSPKSNLVIKVNGALPNNETTSNILFYENLDSTSIIQNIDNSFNEFSGTALFTKRLSNRMALSLENGYWNSDKPQQVNINFFNSDFLTLVHPSIPVDKLLQSVKYNWEQYNSSIGLIGKLGKSIFFDYSVLAKRATQKLFTIITSDISIHDITKFSNDEGINKSLFGQKFVITKQLKKFTFKVQLQHLLLNQTSQNTSSLSVKDSYFPKSISINYKYSTSGSITIAGSESLEYMDLDKLVSGYLLQDYKTYVSGSSTMQPSKTKGAILIFNHRDIIRQFYTSAVLSLREISNPISSSLSLDNASLLITQQPFGISNSFTGSYSITKFISGLKSNFKITGSYNESKYPNMIDNQSTIYNQIKGYNINAYIQTFFKFPVNYAFGIKHNSTSITTANLSDSKFNNSSNRVYANIFYKTKSFKLKLENEYYNFMDNDIFFTDLELKGKISNRDKIQWLFQIKNLFNQNTFISQTLTEYSSSFTNYALLPRQIMAGINLSF